MSEPRLLLLEWAGADWQILQGLMDAGHLPHLQSLADRGAMGRLVSRAPPNPAGTSATLLTGCHADAHGVLDWVQPDEAGWGLRPAMSSDWRQPPLWTHVQACVHGQAGMTSGHAGFTAHAVGFPATHPAHQGAESHTTSILVSETFAHPRGSGFDDWTVDPLSVSPSARADELADLRVHPADLDGSALRPFIAALGHIDQDTDPRLMELANWLAQASTVHSVATHLAEHTRWRLLAVHFDFLERLSERFMAYRAPRLDSVTEHDHAVYGGVVDAAYGFMDLMLGRYLELLGSHATVMVVSGHGFHAGANRPAPQLRPGSGRQAYRSVGTLVAAGPGVRRDALAFGASLVDVAPTALHLLGLPVPPSLQGRVIEALLATRPAPEAAASAPTVPDDARLEPGAELSAGPNAGPHTAPTLSPELQEWAAWRLNVLIGQGRIDRPTGDAEMMAEQAELHLLDLRAQVLMNRGQVQAALGDVEALLQRMPDHRGAAYMRAHGRLALGDVAGCEQALDELAQYTVLTPECELLRIECRLRAGQVDEALARLDQLRGEAPEALPDRIGWLYVHLQRWAQAQTCFEKALQADDLLPSAHTGLGVALAAQNHHEQAIGPLMRSLALQHIQPRTHLQLAQCLAMLGRYTAAQNAALQALEQAPGDEVAKQLLAQIRQQGVAAELAAARER